MTPSSEKIVRDETYYRRSMKKKGEKRLTVAVRVCHDDIARPKLHEKLLYEFQRGVDPDSQRSLRDRSEPKTKQNIQMKCIAGKDVPYPCTR
jgi:hypothetical protein